MAFHTNKRATKITVPPTSVAITYKIWKTDFHVKMNVSLLFSMITQEICWTQKEWEKERERDRELEHDGNYTRLSQMTWQNRSCSSLKFRADIWSLDKYPTKKSTKQKINRSKNLHKYKSCTYEKKKSESGLLAMGLKSISI